MSVEQAVRNAFVTDEVCFFGAGRTNVADALSELANNAYRIANSLSPNGGKCEPASMDVGGYSASVTESLIGVADAAFAISKSIDNLAEVVGQILTAGSK
jgi:hypothetical protein